MTDLVVMGNVIDKKKSFPC